MCHKYGEPSDDRTHCSIVNDLTRQAWHYVEIVWYFSKPSFGVAKCRIFGAATEIEFIIQS